MINHKIGNITFGIFQKDDLIFLTQGKDVDINRLIITCENMNEICRIWQEYKIQNRQIF